MRTINAHLVVGRAALDLRNKKNTEDAHECAREETMGDIDPTEVKLAKKEEKVRDFRHQKQDDDDLELLPGRYALEK